MQRITTLYSSGKEILYLDYSGTKEPEMIAIMLEAKRILLKEKKPQLLLSNYENSYASPGYMNALRHEIREVLPFMSRQAIIGLNEPKQWILKGFNVFLGTDFRSFQSMEEALAYLTQQD